MSIGFNDADIAKIFNTARNLLARCINHRGLIDVLKEPEDDKSIFQSFCEVH